jgi:hypothetical protein
MLKFVLESAAEEVVPFLRRIQTSLQEGSGVQEAYTDALGETKVLKHLIGEPVEGLPFGEGLLEGAKKSKLRPLVLFANQVKLRQGAGESLRESLAKAAATTLTQHAPSTEAERRSHRSRNKKLLLMAGAVAAGLVVARRVRR